MGHPPSGPRLDAFWTMSCVGTNLGNPSSVFDESEYSRADVPVANDLKRLWQERSDNRRGLFALVNSPKCLSESRFERRSARTTRTQSQVSAPFR